MSTRTFALGLVGFFILGGVGRASAQSTTSEEDSPTTKKRPISVAPPSAAAAKKPSALMADEGVTISGGVVITTGSPTAPTTPTTATEPKKDEPSPVAPPPPAPDPPPPAPNPFRGSMIILDQSSSTNTFSKGGQLTYQPTYEWWISPRVNYNFNKNFRVGIRQDLFKEFTNTQGDFVDRGEWRLTDTWLTASYRNKATFLGDNPANGYSLGLTVRPPTSKASRANGQYVNVGPSASLNWGFDLNKGGQFFPSGSLSTFVAYWHGFNKSTTATPLDSGFGYQRTGLDGRQSFDQQVRSGTLGHSTLVYSLNADIEIYDKFDIGASMIYFTQFSYTPKDTTFDGAVIARSGDDTRTRQFNFFFASLNYDAFKEMGFSLGYWNTNSVTGPDGKYRNPFYSADGSRVFFDIVLHLDALYELARGKKVNAGAGGGASGRVVN